MTCYKICRIMVGFIVPVSEGSNIITIPSAKAFLRSYSSRINVFFLAQQPLVGQGSSFVRFLDHTQRRTIFGRNPSDEWSARSRDLYLTHNRQLCPRWDSNPQSQQGSAPVLRLRPRGHWDRPFISKTWKNGDHNFHVFEVPLFHLHWQGV